MDISAEWRAPTDWRIYLYWKDESGIQRVGLRRHGNARVVTSYFKGWPAFFPQHGPGFKHSRAIVLEP